MREREGGEFGKESLGSQIDQVKTGETRKRLMLLCVFVCHFKLRYSNVIGGNADTIIIACSIIDVCYCNN